MYKKPFRKKAPNTSWEKSSQWYNKLVGESGHYYHEHLIIPGVLRLFNLKPGDSMLDIGCGQGILGRQMPRGVGYTGVDLSGSLVRQAQAQDRDKTHKYIVADAATMRPLDKKDFSHAAIILALQNMEKPGAVLKNVAQHLKSGGRLAIVLNHPMFRIPRQSGWDVNKNNNTQYRWITKYMSPMKIPMQMHPGKSNSEITWTFHESLSAYTKFLQSAGLVIEVIEEWSSDKKSTSREKKREDTARAEIPLFMCIIAKKI